MRTQVSGILPCGDSQFDLERATLATFDRVQHLLPVLGMDNHQRLIESQLSVLGHIQDAAGLA